MFFEHRRMKDGQVEPEEILSAIRYLDPDKTDTDAVSDTVAIVALLAIVMIVCAMWGLLWLKVREP